MSDGAATEQLEWSVRSCLGVSVIYAGGYEIRQRPKHLGLFIANHQDGRIIDTGPLLACQHACQEDADAAKGVKQP